MGTSARSFCIDAATATAWGGAEGAPVKKLVFDGGKDGEGAALALSGRATLTSGGYIAGGKLTGASTSGTLRLETGATLYVTGAATEITGTGSGYAVYKNSTGAVNIYDGVLRSASGAVMIPYALTGGVVNVFGGIIECTSNNRTIYNASQSVTVNIYGGMVIASSGNGRSIENSGILNICGGTVSATNASGIAVYNASSGKITVSQADPDVKTVITSVNTSSSQGTIQLGAATAGVTALEITGGTVQNTSNNANARTIYNGGAGNIVISGGKVETTGSGMTLYNVSTGEVNISGGTVEAAGSGSALYNASTGEVNISGGTVRANTGSAVSNSSAGKITISEDDPDVKTLIASSQTGNSGVITLSNSANVVAGMTVLEITGGTVENTYDGASYARAIYSSSAGTVEIKGGTVRAGHVNNTTTCAIYNTSTGVIDISGGTVQAAGGRGIAVHNDTSGKIIIGEADLQKPTLITSENQYTTASRGTVSLLGSSGSLEFTGGTIANTAASGSRNLIYLYTGATATIGSGATAKTVTSSVTFGSFSGQFTYNGNEQKPAFTVPGLDFEAGDFTRSYENNTNAGVATATAKLADALGCTNAYFKVNFTIAKGNQATLTISSPAAHAFGATYALTTSGGSGTGAVTYTVVTGGTGAGTVSGGTLTITKAGTIFITATKAGDDNYNGAAGEQFTLTVNKANQATLTVNAVTGKKYGDAAFQLAAAGGSGAGAVTYELVSGPGTVTAAGMLTITGAGNIVVKATKAADDNYNVITSANLTIAVAKIDQATLTVNAVAGIVIGCVLVAGIGGFAVFWFVIKKKNFSDIAAVFKK